MIDTVVLSIPKSMAILRDRTAEGVPEWDMQAKTGIYKKFVKNPSSKDKESGLYFPRLTGLIRSRGRMESESTIRIEFSVPKLIYGNNVDELTDTQFPEVIKTLRSRLVLMGVTFAEKDLVEAPVMSVHYSKNVQLKNGYTSQYVIGELNKINLNKRFDLTRARYMNDGQSLYAYTQAHSLVIYDKIADLIRGKKRSIDREQSFEQQSLFAPLAKRPEPVEILRFEIRLSRRQKINALFKKFGYGPDPTFQDVFDTEKSKSVVKYYWDTMLSGNMMLLFTYCPGTKDLVKRILLTDRNMKAKEAIYRAGLIWACREGNGIRELRTALAKHANDRTWYRIANDAKDIGIALGELKPHEWCEQILSEFETYKPFHTDLLLCK